MKGEIRVQISAESLEGVSRHSVISGSFDAMKAMAHELYDGGYEGGLLVRISQLDEDEGDSGGLVEDEKDKEIESPYHPEQTKTAPLRKGKDRFMKNPWVGIAEEG